MDMDNFCGSKFWNESLSWKVKSGPDLTYCFEETALLWAPLTLLWIGTVCQVISLKLKEYRQSSYKHRKVKDVENPPPKPFPWTFVNTTQILICLSFVLLSIAELTSTLLFRVNHTDESYVFPVHWAGPVWKIVSFLYLAYVINLYRRNGRFASGVIFLFNLLYLIYSVVNFRTMINAIYYQGIFYPEYNNFYFVCRTIGLTLSIGQLLLSSITENYGEKDLNPHQTSSFLSRITFWWFTKMIITGYRRPLVERDMWRLDKPNTSGHILRRMEQKMDLIKTEKIIKSIQNEAANVTATGYQWIPDRKQTISINVLTLILRIYWKQFALVGLVKLVSSVLMFANPVLMDRLLTFMASDEPAWRGFLYASLMFLFPMIESILNNQYEYWINVVTLRVRTCLISLIYNKSLRLSTVGRRDFSTGEIINIMTVDAQRFTDFLNSVNQIWSSPLQFTIAMYLLWQQVGIAALAGILFLVALVPMNGLISKLIRDIQIRVMKEKDKRTKLMNEILNGIRVLKLYAWEDSFQQKILGFRDQECRHLYKIAYLFGFLFFAFSAAPLMVGVLTFTTYVLTGHVLDPNKAFVSLSLFNIMRVPMGMFPMLLSSGAMCLVAVSRINKYLNSKEIDEEAITRVPNNEFAIQIEDTSFTWDESKDSLLSELNLEIPHGKLIAVVGSVGSGKTSLLSGILGDMEKVSGKVNVDGKLAYVPQQAWIQNATLRKNVVFASNFDEKRYRKVIRACCLEPDIGILTGGDQTEIGEKGINLSGGQKQRISLARAVYSHANIFLLDDPLSAVDANVGKKLFENVIGNNGILRNKTRVLVTHRVAVLPDCDEIVVIKDGKISERGTINELVDSKGAFAEFITEYLDENWDSESNDLDLDDKEDPELMRSLVEKVRPILERSKSRTESVFTSSNVSERPQSAATFGRQFSMSGSTQVRRRKNSAMVASTEMRKKNVERGQLISAEMAETGSVKWTVYLKYFRTIGFFLSVMILSGLIVSNVFQVCGSLWLSEWSNDGLDPIKANDTSLRNTRLIGYAGFGIAEVTCSLVSTLVLNIACIKVSRILHSEMLKSVLFSPTSFYDTTPLGRILNRFTKDIDVADFSLTMNLRMVAMQFFRTIVAFTMISLEAYVILFALLPVMVFYYIIQRVYIATSRQLKRIESITRSPIYNHFGETVNGSTSIRAYGVQDKFIADSNRRIDVNNSCFYSSFVASRWLSIRLEFFGYLIVFIAALFAVISRGELSPGLAGLAISYSLNITSVVGMLIRCSTDLESNVVSIERLIEYSKLESEGEYRNKPDNHDESWPNKGEIRFESYSTRYRTKSDLVLRDISIVIQPGEKVGIVGRTGAGKSSLTLALFRIIEAVNGRIVVDGIDISKLGLYDLRSRITIIPQDPVLFSGTLRLNLDPFEMHTDSELWRALELAHLKEFTTGLGNGLNFLVTEGGENMSVGQRQLLCLARALLRKTKILVLDEATAAVDMETDDLIQATIRTEFKSCTIVTIAHRLNTVIDYDRILVLDQGRVAEYDSPKELLARHDSMFHSMAKDAKLV